VETEFKGVTLLYNDKLTKASLSSKCWHSIITIACQSQHHNRKSSIPIKRILVQQLKKTLLKRSLSSSPSLKRDGVCCPRDRLPKDKGRG